jgi:hypothetical protein
VRQLHMLQEQRAKATNGQREPEFEFELGEMD